MRSEPEQKGTRLPLTAASQATESNAIDKAHACLLLTCMSLMSWSELDHGVPHGRAVAGFGGL